LLGGATVSTTVWYCRSSHAFRSWSFQNICNETDDPIFCSTL